MLLSLDNQSDAPKYTGDRAMAGWNADFADIRTINVDVALSVNISVHKVVSGITTTYTLSGGFSYTFEFQRITEPDCYSHLPYFSNNEETTYTSFDDAESYQTIKTDEAWTTIDGPYFSTLDGLWHLIMTSRTAYLHADKFVVVTGEDKIGEPIDTAPKGLRSFACRIVSDLGGSFFQGVSDSEDPAIDMDWTITDDSTPDPLDLSGTFNAIDGGTAAVSLSSALVVGVKQVRATTLIAGYWYEIVSVEDSDFTLAGAPDNLVGTRFWATSATGGWGQCKSLLEPDNKIQWLSVLGSTLATDPPSILPGNFAPNPDLRPPEFPSDLYIVNLIGASTDEVSIDPVSMKTAGGAINIGGSAVDVDLDYTYQTATEATEADCLDALNALIDDGTGWVLDTSPHQTGLHSWTGKVSKLLRPADPYVVDTWDNSLRFTVTTS
jgi:hypothetical protein